MNHKELISMFVSLTDKEQERFLKYLVWIQTNKLKKLINEKDKSLKNIFNIIEI